MNTLRHFVSRLPITALLLPLMMLASSCRRFNADGSLAPWGVLLAILDIWALVNIFG
ncbi:hypothetical protein I2H31_22765, partial [Hymenobacter sp. BT662]|nr:hypothetical protein [Hymenobacter ruricola]